MRKERCTKSKLPLDLEIKIYSFHFSSEIENNKTDRQCEATEEIPSQTRSEEEICQTEAMFIGLIAATFLFGCFLTTICLKIKHGRERSALRTFHGPDFEDFYEDAAECKHMNTSTL